MSSHILQFGFYSRHPKIVARELLGKTLVSTIGGKRSAGIIVETEAYLSSNDSACHGYGGKTRKNSTMFGAAGHAYVYPIHAKHCFNPVTETPGMPSAVLVRALEPTGGLKWMADRRGTDDRKNLCSGPAKLCQALGIDRSIDGCDLTLQRRLWLVDNAVIGSSAVRRTRRIGVTSAKTTRLRFVIRGHDFASGPKYLR